MNTDIPQISVILPVYNGKDHLVECIESILKQSFKDFEFIIVDDASTDNTPELLRKYSEKDNRIKILTHKTNQKQTAAANTAIKHARGKYIARMDADDIALPNRLSRQIEFIQKYPDIGLVGSWVDIIDNNGKILKTWKTLETDGILKWNLLFGTSFAHSSVMMRKDIVKNVGYYQSPEAEDYDLWSRISHVSKVANITEVLQQKRVWPGQLALKVPQETRDCVIEIMQKNINNLLGNSSYDLQTIRYIRAVSDKTPVIEDNQTITIVRNIFMKMYKNLTLKVKLTKNEKNYITGDLYRKLKKLSEWQLSLNFIKGLYQKAYLVLRFPKLSTINLLRGIR